MSKRRLIDSPLRNVRVARTLTQRQLADLIDVAQQTIEKAEAGKITLRPDLQDRIAAILGVARHDIFPVDEQVAS